MRKFAALRWATVVAGCLALGIGMFLVGKAAIAQQDTDVAAVKQQQDENALQQFGQQPGQPGRPGQPGFPGGRGGFGGPGRGFPGGFPGMMGGGGPSMVANEKTVFVLQGDRLISFDANSLKLKAQTQVPHPQPPPGFGPGGPRPEGFPGAPRDRGGAKPEKAPKKK